MDPAEKMLTVVFLTATMLSIGLKVTPADLLASLRQRSLMARSLAVNFILIPILGLALVKALPLSADVATALLLLAAAPGGLNAIQFTSKGGALSFAAALLFILSLLAVLVSPALAGVILPAGVRLVLPYGRIAAVLFLGVLLPLLAGLLIARAWHRAAEMLAAPMAAIGTAAFVIVVLLLMVQRKQAMAALKAIDLAAMLGLILIAMILGWLLGGPLSDTRRILATASSMRNAALALIIAVNSFPETDVEVAVVAFSGLMIPPNMLFTVYHVVRRRRSRRAARVEC